MQMFLEVTAPSTIVDLFSRRNVIGDGDQAARLTHKKAGDFPERSAALELL